MKDIFIKLFNVLVVLLSLVSVFACGLLAYFKTIGSDKVPQGISSTYATTVVDPQTGEEIPVLEANYYENVNGKGKEVIEFKINCYSDVTGGAIYARGFQMVFENGNPSGVYYYDSSNGYSFITGHEYKWGDKMVVDINGKNYAIALDGKYSYTKKTPDTAKAFRTGLTLGFNLIFENLIPNKEITFYKTEVIDVQYTWSDLLMKFKAIIKSCSSGTGDYIIPLVDLGDFLHMYEIYDDGSVSGEPIGKGGLINSYFSVNTHYCTRGMVWTKQSIFGSIAGDFDYNVSGLIDEAEYWTSPVQYIINQNDFVERYSATDNGYYYSLSNDFINEIKCFENVECSVNFDISKLNKNVLGFDFYALNGLKLKSLTITSDISQSFTFQTGSLKDTGLTSSKILLENVVANNINSGVAI